MTGSDHILFPFFEDMRRNGLPLGVSEYEAAVKCLWAGIGLESPDDLREMLAVIWATSREERALLNDRFRIMMAPVFQHTPSEADDAATDDSRSETATDTRTQEHGASFQVLFTKDGKTVPPDFLRQQGPGPDMGPEKDRFQFIPRFPVRRREMTVAFRGLRLMRRCGVPEELDIDETIDGIGNTGFFTGPVLRPLRRNTAFLLVLTDRKGSMDPFLPLTENLLESILKGGMLGRVRTLYFHNFPGNTLYENPELTLPVLTEDVIRESAPRPCALIVSDAGAAKGYYDGERFQATMKFLDRLNGAKHRNAWINPVPRDRWPGTTAEAIALKTPMFPLSPDGLKDTVDLLRGAGSASENHDRI